MSTTSTPRLAPRALLVFGACLLSASPCQAEPPPQARLDPAGEDFFGLPFPANHRLLPEGGPDLRGLPNPRGEAFIRRCYALAQTDVRGFSPSGPIYLPFEGPVHAPPADPLAPLAPGAPVLLVDVDPASPARLTRHPFHARVTEVADSFRPAHLLQLLPVPGRGLRKDTTYAAIVLRSLGAPGQPRLAQHPELARLLSGQPPREPRLVRLAEDFVPLLSALQELGIAPEDVAAATVFRTGDPTARLVRQVAHQAQLPAPPLATPLRVRDRFPEFTALRGSFPATQYQEGLPPFLFRGGRQVCDAAGLPQAQRTAPAGFQLSIPRGPMPAAGFPLFLYVHGTGGRASQAIDRGRVSARGERAPRGSGLARDAARHGWATACVAGLFSPDRLGLLAGRGYLAYNVLNPVAMRDNIAQMVLEQVQFRSLLLELRLDPALCPGTDVGAATDGKVRFDPARVVVGGQSLGSYLAGMLAATLDGFRGAVLSGAGGSWVEFAFGPKYPFRLQQAIELLALPLGERLDRWHPLIAAFDLAAGPADNTHYLPYILREPLPGHDPPHLLVIEGHEDLQVSTELQRALVLATGVEFVGEDPGATPGDQLLPVLPIGGLRRLSPPVAGNLHTRRGPRTAVVLRYPEDGILEGHHVLFQLEEPRRRMQEFLADLGAGRLPQLR